MTLSNRHRNELGRFLEAAPAGRARLRAQALLWLDAGTTVVEVAGMLGVTRQTVYNWMSRHRDRRRADLGTRLGDAPRPGRPRSVSGVIDPLIAEAIGRSPRELGHDRTVWTGSLLVRHLKRAHGLDVSRKSVCLALGRIGAAEGAASPRRRPIEVLSDIEYHGACVP
jgi:transposase